MRDWRTSLSPKKKAAIRAQNLEHAKKRYRENPEWAKDRSLRQDHDMTLADFLLRVKKQNGRCAICGILLETIQKERGANKACVDHDHETNQTRGILCSSCNRALGFLHDSVVILSAALTYLKFYKENT